ncbi:hypothetical protein BGZ91_001730, partial [Linnemannia elongata]
MASNGSRTSTASMRNISATSPSARTSWHSWPRHLPQSSTASHSTLDLKHLEKISGPPRNEPEFDGFLKSFPMLVEYRNDI